MTTIGINLPSIDVSCYQIINWQNTEFLVQARAELYVCNLTDNNIDTLGSYELNH